MIEAFTDVYLFHKKFGCHISGCGAELPAQEVRDLRIRLIREEFEELLKAEEDNDIVEIADALADLIYVTIGAALAYGIPLVQVWDEVQRSNMAKEGATTRADGKIVKPEGWKPPDIKKIIDDYNESAKAFKEKGLVALE